MRKKLRVFAAVAAVFIFSEALFSICFLAAEANHDCTGEDCAICCEMSRCERMLESVLASIAVVFTGLLISNILTQRLFDTEFLRHISLITLKVKLSN